MYFRRTSSSSRHKRKRLLHRVHKIQDGRWDVIGIRKSTCMSAMPERGIRRDADLKGWRRQSATGWRTRRGCRCERCTGKWGLCWQEEETEWIRSEMKRTPYEARGDAKLGKRGGGAENRRDSGKTWRTNSRLIRTWKRENAKRLRYKQRFCVTRILAMQRVSIVLLYYPVLLVLYYPVVKILLRWRKVGANISEFINDIPKDHNSLTNRSEKRNVHEITMRTQM